MYAIEADQASFRRVIRALNAESDGRELRRDLVSVMTEALQPAVAEVRGALFARSSAGLEHVGVPLRPAIAADVGVVVRAGLKNPVVGIKAGKRGMPRGFRNAAKRFNERSFRHKVYGRDVWVVQVGAPGWFDDTLNRSKAKYQRAVERALERMARRIERRA